MANYAILLKENRNRYDEAEKYYLKSIEFAPDYANYYYNYAFFLNYRMGKYIEAEKYYLKTLELKPDGSTYNCGYADFLTDIRRKYDEAEKYYKKAIEIKPDNADIHGNYAKLLIMLNREDEAIEHINKAFERNKESEEGLTLELWFYCYAIYPQRYPESNAKIEALLEKGIQSMGWDLSEILSIAKKNNHPHYDTLVEFDKRITQTPTPGTS